MKPVPVRKAVLVEAVAVAAVAAAVDGAVARVVADIAAVKVVPGVLKNY